MSVVETTVDCEGTSIGYAPFGYAQGRPSAALRASLRLRSGSESTVVERSRNNR
ncbi:hypothetical protein [Caldithrix abyssi]